MEQIWWEKVPNALMFISDIADNLMEEKSLILLSESNIPWHSAMKAYIKDIIKQHNSSKRFKMVQDVNDPGPYLLREYCKPEKRASYRPTKSYAKFFAESDDIVLHSNYFWVKVDSLESAELWSNFVSEYIKNRNKNKEIAVFVLEWCGKTNISLKRGIKQYLFDDYINEYDRLVFSVLASSSLKEDPLLKNYLAELTTTVIGNDIELCAECLKRYPDFLLNPKALIDDIVKNHENSNDESYVFNKSKDEINHCIWLAQIKTVYPIIETFRERFVEKHNSMITAELPIPSAYGESYTDPKDVELGTLVFMAANKKLYLNSHEYEILKAFKDARNKLSHLTVLSICEIQQLCNYM